MNAVLKEEPQAPQPRGGDSELVNELAPASAPLASTWPMWPATWEKSPHLRQ